MKKLQLFCLMSLFFVISLAQNSKENNFLLSKFGSKYHSVATARSGEIKSSIKKVQIVKTINATPGSLNSQLTSSEKKSITDLTITGSIDATDFRIMRDSLPFLSVLDISAVTIASYTGSGGTGDYNTTYAANEIPENSFYIPGEEPGIGFSVLTSIKLPTSATSIGEMAFSFCSTLGAVTISPLISKIGILAFVGCSAKISVDANNPYFSSVDGVLFDKAKTTLIQCPLSVTGNYDVPSTVKTITMYGFCFCDKLTSINIPSTVQSIGMYAFTSCSGAINVDANNLNYTSRDGVLFNKSLTTLIQCGTSIAGSYTVPLSVDTIADNSFYNCSSMASISIPSSVSYIADLSFYNCSGLASITLNGLPISLSSSYNVFNNVNFDTCILNVPYGTKPLYQSASVWNNFKNIVENAHGFILGKNKLMLSSVAGSNGKVAIISNDAWTLSSNQSWLTVSPQNGSGKDSILFIAEANPLPESRTAIVTVSAEGIQPQTIQVIQTGIPKILNLTAGTLSTSMTAAELNSVISLKIKGIIDARDFKTMRDNMQKLAFLDISEVTIAAYNGSDGTSNIATTYPANRIPDYAFNIGMSSQQFTLSTIKLPLTINAIGDYAFYSCEALTDIVIPNSVTYIGQGGFGSCYNLMNVVLPNQLTSIESQAFTGCGMSSITIPNTVKSIAYYGFSSCRNLKSVVIPNSVTNISNSAFERCTALTDLTIGNSVNYIGNSAFNGCSNLASVVIPNSVQTLDGNVFAYCTNLKSVILPNSLTTVGYSSFYECTNLLEITIPNSVTKIDYSAFAYCTKLTNVVIPNSVITIGSSAFANCTALSKLSIGKSVTTIESYAFNYCSSLVTLTIPNSITTIGDYAFGNCTGLTAINVEWDIPFNISTLFGLFDNVNKTTCTLNVPFGTKNLYATAFQWNNFINIVENIHGLKLSSVSVKLSSIEGSSASVSITSNDQWTAVSDQTWLKVSPSTGIGNDSLKLTADANVSSLKRTAKVTVSTGAYTKEITVIQAASPKIVNITAGGLAKALTADELNTITNLTISGKINSRDFKIMRDSMPNIEILDLTSTSIDVYTGSLGTAGGYNYTYPANEIPQSAFYNSNAYLGKITLNTIILPATTTSIGSSAFMNCKGLVKAIVPITVTKIGSSSFESCIALTDITLSDSIKSLGSAAFKSCKSLTSINIPNTLTSLGDNMFSECSSITELTIPNKVTSINWSTFAYCTGLKTVTIGSSVTKIGYSSFINCSSLINLILPNSILTIDDHAFENCSALTNLTLPKSLTSLGYYSFSNCINLTDVVIPNSVNNMDYGSFYNCTKLKSVTISNSLKALESAVFGACTSLNNVVIPNSVTSIESSAFLSCTGLTNITIPESVVSIGSEAFRSCVGLTSFSIPASVTRIDWSAFNSCTNLTSIYANPLIPVDLSSVGMSSDVFYNIDKTNCILYVPYQTKVLYAAAIQWKDFLNIVENPNGLGIETNNVKLTSVAGANASVKVTSNTTWSVTSDQTWLKVSPENNVGNGSLKLTADENPTFFVRTAIVTVSVTGVPSKTITVSQAAAPKVLDITAGTLSSKLSADELKTITNIQITGTIDARDFRTMRDDMPALTTINISNATIAGYTGINGTLTSFNWAYAANEVPANAFFDNIHYTGKTSLTSLLLPVSIVSFGGDAFRNCSGLDSISIPDTVTKLSSNLFGSCSGLKKVRIGKSVTIINEYAFNNCSAMTEINIPNSVTLIKYDAFSGCSNLASIIIPPSVIQIEYNAFNRCGNLTTLSIPNSVTSIGSNAFTDCVKLKTVTLSNSISLLDYGTFQNCTALTEIIIPESVTSIGSYAFRSCTSLSSIIIPNFVKSINYNAFSACTGLNSIVIPNSVVSIGGHAFGECTGLTNVTLGNSLTQIDYEAFYGCSNLSGINIPNSVTTIGSNAFSNCSSLKYLTLGNSVVSIGSEAFKSCSGLTTLSIPASVTRIDWSAFYSCTALTSIYAYSSKPVDISSPGMSSNIFYNVNKTNCILFVPQGSKALYQAAVQWKDFSKIIEMTTAVPNLTYANIKIYPNPVKEFFKIEGLTEKVNLSIVDLTGKVLINRQIIGNEPILVGDLIQGVYLVRINTSTGVFEQKIIKE
ncbi:MAG: leucine-rich repeat protein [Paludibacter sp.]